MYFLNNFLALSQNKISNTFGINEFPCVHRCTVPKKFRFFILIFSSLQFTKKNYIKNFNWFQSIGKICMNFMTNGWYFMKMKMDLFFWIGMNLNVPEMRTNYDVIEGIIFILAIKLFGVVRMWFLIIFFFSSEFINTLFCFRSAASVLHTSSLITEFIFFFAINLSLFLLVSLYVCVCVWARLCKVSQIFD